jgi:hypothetical protein
VVFVEEALLGAIRKMLAGRVNEFLEETEYSIPTIEFGQSGFTGLSPEFRHSRNSTMPSIGLSTCERTEKERIIGMDAYTLTIAFTVPEHPDGERCCYAYTAAVATVLGEDPTLGGVADRVELTGKKYSPPKCAGTGADWGIELKIHILVDF